MATYERFEDMEVWRDSRALVREIYQFTMLGAWARDFGLRDQIRRAAVSVTSSVAEGFERGSDKDFRRFLFMAKASAAEVRSLLYVATDAEYMDAETHKIFVARSASIGRQLGGLIAYLDESETGRKMKRRTMA